MRLTRVGLWGYKRFRDTQEMDVDGKLIAVVGPNEAGKTSLLEALRDHLNEAGEAMTEGELTRNMEPREAQVWARYVLDDSDREALGKEVHEAIGARRMTVYKHSDTSFWHEVEPEVHRDLAPRERARKLVERALGSRWLRENDDEEDSIGSALLEARQVLESKKETIAGALQAVRELRSALGSSELPASLKSLPDQLDETIKHESQEHPKNLAVAVLEPRRPRFRFFSDDARRLRSSYRLDEPTNQALHNFLALAGTSWNDISAAHPDEGRLRAIEERAEKKLGEAFAVWQQSDLEVRLRISNETVFILVGMDKAHDYLGVEERSDGLRQFIALRAYVRTQEDFSPPVLLIDEAENHLHYDAQADLIEVLIKQEDAAKVIYTTHSAGCLPFDLGTGVRMVVPKREEGDDRELHPTDDSEIVNWFWLAPPGTSGFTPLLLGMGASTFAFASTRKAVIAEGAGDAILLPTLFREVTGRDALDFQIAPGLAHVTREAVDELDLVAARVAYLVDRDQGGRDRRKQLQKAGVPAKRIFYLSEGTNELTLEDLVQKDVYREAVNGLLKEQHGLEMPAQAFPANERHAAVEAWCSKRAGNVEAPGKRAIAHGIVEQRHNKQLVAGNRRAGLRALHDRIQKLLDQPTHKSS